MGHGKGGTGVWGVEAQIYSKHIIYVYEILNKIIKNTNKTTKESHTKGNVKGVFQEEIKQQSEILTQKYFECNQK